MASSPPSKSSPSKRRFDSLPLPPLYYSKDAVVDKTGRANPIVNVRGRSAPNTAPSSPQSFKTLSPISQNASTRSLSKALLSAKYQTPPSTPMNNKMMVLSTPSPAGTLETVTMTPETIASLSSFYDLSPSPMTRTYAAVSSPKTLSSPSVLDPYKQPNYLGNSGYYASPTRCVLATPPGTLTHNSPISGTPTSFGGLSECALVSPTNRSPAKRKVPFVPGSPTPDDSCRKQKVKTELCMHYLANRVCPFGNSCTYAHGETELQKTKLIDLQRSGLIDDVETYRTKPCFTWVMVGSCPYGRRCASIHDPRVTGTVSSWLPLTETQGNNINTDINVEGLHQKRLHTILYGNPFGQDLSIAFHSWDDLYKLVTNTTPSNRRRRNTLPEIQKLSIAIQMRGGHQWMYKYRPQHVIFQDLCMILDKQAFCIESDSGEAVPIPISKYRPGNPKHVMVREIAFGPDSDPTTRGVALWFNIPEIEVVECTAQQAKRFRWRKASKSEDNNMEQKTSVFDSRECFTMIRPHDSDAFNLASRILIHRYETLKAERLSSLNARHAALKKLSQEHDALQEMFSNYRRHWVSWTYPINEGRQLFDDDTPVPHVDAEYNPIIDANCVDQENITHNTNDEVEGSEIQKIWQSFITCVEPTIHGDSGVSIEDSPFGDSMTMIHNRQEDLTHERSLSVFLSLRRGEHISKDRALPHIKSPIGFNSTPSFSTSFHRRQSERCWKALLLKKNQVFDSLYTCNEWDEVVDHFQNYSRSKKVLSIIQK